MAGPDASAEKRLRVIAGILGTTVSELCDGGPSKRLADSAECVRLWDQLKTDAGRAAVLDCLREALTMEDT